MTHDNAAVLARHHYETCEEIAPDFGFPEEDAHSWDDIPDEAKEFMTEAMRKLLAAQIIVPGPRRGTHNA